VRALGLTRWHETAALLAGGDVALARDDATRLFEASADAGDEPPSLRFELVYARVRALLARYAGDIVGALGALEVAADLANTLALPGECWQILVEVGQCASALGCEGRRQAAYSEAQQSVGSLAGTIDDPATRAAFVAAARRLSTRAAHGPA
jgi:hypothetical protein